MFFQNYAMEWLHQEEKKKKERKKRSSHLQVFYEKGVLRNFAKFIGKQLCQSPFSNPVAGQRPEAWNFIKKEALAQVFSCKFCEISKNTFYYRTHLWSVKKERKFFKLASVESVKTACVCVALIFPDFKHGPNSGVVFNSQSQKKRI